MAEKKDAKPPKRMNFALKAEYVAWASYAAGLNDASVTEYINDAIRRDMEGEQGIGADKAVKDGYAAFLKARPIKPAE